MVTILFVLTVSVTSSVRSLLLHHRRLWLQNMKLLEAFLELEWNVNSQR